MIYLKESSSNRIVSFDNEASIGASFENWQRLNESEALDYELEQAKEKRIEELKKNREAYLISDYVSHQAIELVEDENGEFSEGNLVYFAFQAKPTGNPASEPNSILLGAVLMGSANPSHYLRYSCTIIEQENRKGYVKIDASTAAQLIGHIQERNINGIKLTNDREKLINEASSIEEVNSIEITF